MRSRQFLEKVLAIQTIYRTHKREEVTNIGIFRIHIRKHFFVSERTFYRYLEIPAAKLLKDMGEEKPNGG